MKRIISLVLSLVIILSLVCVAAPSVSAASAMTTSDVAINMIKAFEGFEEFPYEDNGQWSVGYGTRVTGEDLEYYEIHGITEEQATKLMKEYLASFESSLNSFIDTHSLKLSQNKFDALICFTYNLGPSWMNETGGTFRNAVISGATGNDFIFAMTQFSKASGRVNTGLAKRRLCEANLYLNGVYGNVPPVNYKYVIYVANIEDAIPSVAIQGYDTTKVAAVKSTISKSGYRFLGWYTKIEGGSNVTSLGSNTASNSTLYAHWQNGDGERNEDGTIKGVAAEYSGYVPAAADHTIYTAPNGEALKTAESDDKLSVVAEYMDESGVKWGKLSTEGWIKVTAGLDAVPAYEDPASIIDPVVVTVTTSNVNNRIGPGTNYASQGKFTKGQQLTLTAVQKGGNYMWGKSEQGWICLKYTDYETAILKDSDEANKVTAIGTIIKADVLNVRSGPGVHNTKVGTYNRGDQVKITLRQKVGNTTWGLTEKGWISLYYVQLTEVEEGEVPDIDTSTGTGTDTDTDTETATSTVLTGKIVNCTTLRIRAAAGTAYKHIGNYTAGTYVTIYETTKVGNATWGRTDKGWISLYYVQLDAPSTGEGVTGRIINCTSLNVRAGAGTNYAKVGKLDKGTRVEILEYTKVGNATWGRITQGWIHLYYVKLDAPLSDLDKMAETDTEVGTGGTEDGTGTGSDESTGTGSDESTGSDEGTGSETTETQETRVITVITNDAEGNPVAGVSVNLWVNPGSNAAHYKLLESAKKTDDKGEALFNETALMDIPADAILYAVVSGTDHDFAWNADRSNKVRAATAGTGTEVLPESGQDYLKVTAAAGKTFSGTFTLSVVEAEKVERSISVIANDAEGNPVAGVSVSIMCIKDGQLEAVTDSMTTGADGKAVFEGGELLNVAKGTRLVAEVGGDYTYAWTGAEGGNTVRTATAGSGVTVFTSNLQDYLDVTATEAESFDGTFTVSVAKVVKPERTITVMAVDAEGNPVAGVPFTIQYVQNGTLVPATGTLTTGADGKVVFYNGALLDIAKGARLVAEVGAGYTYAWTGAVGGNTVRTATATTGFSVFTSALQDYLDVLAAATEGFEGTFTVSVVAAAE